MTAMVEKGRVPRQADPLVSAGRVRNALPGGLAEVLESSHDQILAEYERMLASQGSRLVRDPSAREQVLAHAGHVLTDVVNSLRANDVMVDDGRKSLATRIGSERAAAGVHPVESLEAAAEMFKTIMARATCALQTTADEVLPLSLVGLAMHQSLMTKIRNAATSYTGFLLDQIYQAHVYERRVLARELHDRVGTQMSIAHRQLELYEMYREREPALADQRAAAAHEALLAAMRDIRELNSSLRLSEPMENLEKALRKFLDSAAFEVVTKVVVNGDERWVPPAVLDEVFLVIREALRNALAHAQPSAVLANVDIAPHELRATVDDDGTGFDVKATGADGSGLPSMRERVALLGGVLMLSSAPRRGARVEFIIPLPQGSCDAAVR